MTGRNTSNYLFTILLLLSHVGYVIFYHMWSRLYIVLSHVECIIYCNITCGVLYIVLSHVECVIYCIVTCGVCYILYSRGPGWRPAEMSEHANPHHRWSPGKAKLWVDWLNLFNAELCPKGSWRVPRSQRVCERRLYLTLH